MSLDPEANRVSVILNGEETFIVEEYVVTTGLLQQPSTFTVRLGTSDLAASLMKRYPPRTSFELQIAGTRQFVGRTDGWSVMGSGGTALVLTGRDSLAPLHDGMVRADQSFKEISYADLVIAALDDTVGAGYTLYYSNDANRIATALVKGKGKKKKSFSGGKAGATKEQVDGVEAAGVEAGIFTKATAGTKKGLEIKAGQRWFNDVVTPQLKRAGLMLWARNDGSFALTAPDPNQDPLFAIRHRRGDPNNIVLDYAFTNNTAGRFTEASVHGRRGGGAETRTKVSGVYVDQEMVDLGFDRPLVMVDAKTKSPDQAEDLARFRIAECNRQSRQLNYIVAGHSTMALSGALAIWTRDTVVTVDDEEIGVDGPFLIESCVYQGNPHTTTSIGLMRPEDCVFGDPIGEES